MCTPLSCTVESATTLATVIGVSNVCMPAPVSIPCSNDRAINGSNDEEGDRAGR